LEERVVRLEAYTTAGRDIQWAALIAEARSHLTSLLNPGEGPFGPTAEHLHVLLYLYENFVEAKDRLIGQADIKVHT
jgi:hypothetical protein